MNFIADHPVTHRHIADAAKAMGPLVNFIADHPVTHRHPVDPQMRIDWWMRNFIADHPVTHRQKQSILK